jgi:hypothetical protein
MNLKNILLLVALFTCFKVNGQVFNLPKGYQTFKDYEGKEQRADGDFDGDGLNDLAIVCTATNGSNIIVVYLASKWLIEKSYWWFPWTSEMNSLEFNNNVLTISSSDCSGRCYTNLIFKYYANLNNLKLIGYEEGNYGNAEHEGAFNKNINLNTGEYEIAGIKRKVTLDVITLTNIEKYFEYLSSVGANYIEK